jgi:uncharacterized membrane protein YbaN (DUF454 family)
VSEAVDSRETRPSVLRSPRRLLLAALGFVCVGVALAGVFLPGLPTTIFLIAASYLFTRSCPWLEERVLRLRIFQPFVPYVRGDRSMPMRARITALLTMWVAIAVSLLTLALGDGLSRWVAIAFVAAGVTGSWCILNYRRTIR